jgi:hypothetical protein
MLILRTSSPSPKSVAVKKLKRCALYVLKDVVMTRLYRLMGWILRMS